jgi:hypothetical protein
MVQGWTAFAKATDFRLLTRSFKAGFFESISLSAPTPALTTFPGMMILRTPPSSTLHPMNRSI